jgi:hypothetical protein
MYMDVVWFYMNCVHVYGCCVELHELCACVGVCVCDCSHCMERITQTVGVFKLEGKGLLARPRRRCMITLKCILKKSSGP